MVKNQSSCAYDHKESLQCPIHLAFPTKTRREHGERGTEIVTRKGDEELMHKRSRGVDDDMKGAMDEHEGPQFGSTASFGSSSCRFRGLYHHFVGYPAA